MELFDLTIFPLSLDAGQEQHELPGLFVASAPRKTARMRSQDILILLLNLTTPSGGPAAITAVQEQEILNRLSETYFTTPGSVTAGLRAVVTRLNDFLFGRNLGSGQGGQIIGVLNLASLHGNILTLAHGGPTHSFFLGKTRTQHFDDGLGLRGLGLSRQATPRFYQTELADHDTLIICPDPPQIWDQGLGTAQNLTLEHLRRRMLSNAGVQLKAVVAQVSTGKGIVHYWRPVISQPRPIKSSPSLTPAPFMVSQQVNAEKSPEAPPVVQDNEQPVMPEIIEELGTEAVDVANGMVAADGVDLAVSDQNLSEPSDILTGEDDFDTPELDVEVDHPAAQAVESSGIRLSRAVSTKVDPDTAARLPEHRSRARVIKPAENPPAKPRSSKPTPVPATPPSEVIRRNLAPAWRKGSAVRARTVGVFSKLSSRLFPKRSEPLINLSPSVMLMIAIIVPILIGTAGGAVYYRLGRTERFETLFSQARQYAAQTSQLTDPVQQREGWKRVLEMINEAKVYGSSAEAVDLVRQAQNSLDQLEGHVRLDFRPVSSSGFEHGVIITRMLAKLNQVYLLDSSQGRILSMTRLTTGGYEINPFFGCGPGKAGGTYIGPLIDLAELPVNNELNAEVLGIDAGGNLVYCAGNKPGFDSRTLAIPDAGWGEIKGIVTYNDTLYVLDPKGNAVYWYSGERGMYADAPHLYFDENIPQMADVIDLAVDQEFLYLLHADGRMTICTSGGVLYGSTRCTDPAPYGDGREGYEPSPLTFLGTNLTQIQTTEPPDPSLFALDTLNTSIYHLSQRRMNLQKQYRPMLNSDFPVPNRPVTAFAISPNRRALLAFGNQVFFAPLP